LDGYELCPFGLATSMNENMFFELREHEIVLEIALPSLIS